ncbi:hypothetical protein MRX96_055447 [Rhipicephalus microplus]
MADDDEPLMPRRDSTVAAGVLDDSEMNGEPLSEASPLRANYCLAVRITASVLCCAALVVAAIVAGMFLDTTFKREENVLHRPNNIAVVETSPSKTRISWTASNTPCGATIAYDVEVCAAYETCVTGSSGKLCTTHRTRNSWLVFNSTVGTSYCIQVTAKAQRGEDALTSTPTFKEIVTPLFAPGDFEVTVSAINSSSVVLVVSVPLIKNGALDLCYITYNHTGGGHYAFTVTFVNKHGGRQVATQKVISVTTLAPLKGHNNLTDNVEFWLGLALIAFIHLKSDNRPRRRRSRRRR